MDLTIDRQGTTSAERMLAAVRQPLVLLDTHFQVRYFNEAAGLLLEWVTEEILGSNILQAAGIHMAKREERRILHLLGSGEEVTEEFWLTKRGGEQILVVARLDPFLDDRAKVVGIVVAVEDATARRAIEDANWRLSEIVESSSEAVVGFDLEGRITTWNKAAVGLFRTNFENALGRSIVELARPPRFFGPPFSEILERLRDGAPVSFEGQLAEADGSVSYLECLAHTVRDHSDRVVGGAVICRDVTSDHLLRHQAALEHQRLQQAQQIARIGSFDFDPVTNVANWSPELREVLGWPDDEPDAVETFLSRVHPEDQPLFEREVLEPIRANAPRFEVTYRFVCWDGTERWLHTLGRTNGGGNGNLAHVVGATQDITEQVAKAQAFQLAEQRFSVAFELGSVGMAIIGPDRRVQRVNPTICRILGRTPEEIVGHDPAEFRDPKDVESGAPRVTGQLFDNGRNHIELEWRCTRPDGTTAHTIVHLARVTAQSGEPLYFFVEVVDITDRKRSEEELERLAMQDPLTGLPNRNLLTDRLSNALRRCRRSGGTVAVLFVDVDHFKLVNDSLGHASGDELLRQLAHRLSQCTRSGDTVARFGGDEFVLVCEEVADVNEAIAIGERVGALSDQSFLVSEQQMYITLSCGIVLATPEDTAATLLRDADTAMYQAKEKGRARYELFGPKLRSETTRRLDIELAMRRALENDEFHLVYQPIISLADGVALSIEALIRWEHPERGTILPLEFITRAEDTGLIIPIGEWVLEHAMAETARWRSTLAGAGELSVCVNVSPRQLTSRKLLERARSFAASYGLPPSAVCLEITESAAMDDVDVSLPILREIAEDGFVLAIDDFGAGYSSLSRLKRLPVGMLKIDRSFVDGLGRDNDDSLIVRAIVSLGNALGLELCAEGVETADQLAVLSELDCQKAQGYFWAKPMRADHFEQWWREFRLKRPQAVSTASGPDADTPRPSATTSAVAGPVAGSS